MSSDSGNIRRKRTKKLGLLKGACFASVLCLAASVSPAQTFTTRHSFDGTDGADPNWLVQGTDGNFYGTTGHGGAVNPCPADGGPGCGTVFQITPAGVLTILHSFNGTDGYFPNGLIQGSDGKFYGTTATSIYSIVPGGTPVILASVNSPHGPLVQGTDGSFYGTTADSSFGASCPGECGTVFKMTPAGTLTTLYTFDGTGGIDPNGGLVQYTDGNFYGTTLYGGALGCGPSNPVGDCGTIFKITPQGTLTLLYSFCEQHGGCPDGFGPSRLVQGTDGNFYGTTGYGGNLVACDTLSYPVYFSCGTVFKITPGGTLTTLHLFDSTDGGWPLSGVIQGSDGNFYGTTALGGANGTGTIFKMTSAGTLIPFTLSPVPSASSAS